MAAPYLAALHRTVAALQSQLSETQYQLQEARRFGRLTRKLHCQDSTLNSAPVDWIYNGDMRMWSEPVVDELTDEKGGGKEEFQAVQTWVEGVPALAANWSAHFEGYSYSLHGEHTPRRTASARIPSTFSSALQLHHPLHQAPVCAHADRKFDAGFKAIQQQMGHGSIRVDLANNGLIGGAYQVSASGAAFVRS